MRPRTIAIVAAAAMMFAAACRTPPPPVARAYPSVLLVTIDTLRADRVGAYGGPAGLTPRLDALAREGAVFDEAVSSAPLTLPSHSTILSGLDPPSHGVHDNGTYVFPQDRETLATVLKARGYATGAFVGAYVLDRRFGLARGFDAYDDAIERREEGASVLESERRGERVAAAAEAWLARQRPPFLAWAHFYDPHAPYDPPPAFGAPARPAYDGEVAYADNCLGRVLDAARRAAGDAGLVVAVLGDHGEALREHGESTHGFFLYQSTLRVPLLLAGPGITAGQRVAGLARTADVMPTLLRIAGVEPPRRLDGADLLRGPRARESYAETDYPRTFGWAPLRAYRVGSLKYVAAPRPELYDLTVDPGETHDLAASRPTDAARLSGLLAAVREHEGGGGPARFSDPEVAERLRALGYVAAEPPPGGTHRALADPKDRIALWDRFQKATAAEMSGDRTSAIAALRHLVAADPGNGTFRRTLAATLRRAGQARQALAVLGDVRAPAEDALVWHERAIAAEAAGDLSTAVAAAQRALALAPQLPELHNHMGVLHTRGGEMAAALSEFDRAISLDPNNGRARSNRGNARRALGRSEEAAQDYAEAARLAPGDPDALNGLGVLAVERGELDRASALFREVLAAHPEHHESRLNLAVVLVRGGRVDDARALLRALLAAHPDRETAARAQAFLRDLS